jgi:hypothetical protein
MKKFIITSILAALLTAGTTLMAQDYPDEYLGLPGDNLNLYAVMNLFQQSETLEGFEKTLNDENTKINNLDLNGDNFVDYLMVKDYVDGDVHTIVLQVALNQYEKQDVAVFTVQRFQNGSVQIQLIGDEALYGRNYIIEPIYDDISGETPNPGYIGRSRNNNNVNVVRTTYYEVASWPMIRFIYRPNYVIWHSSWNWGYYPSYWHPWSPSYWDYYYGYHYNWYPDYYRHYRHWQQPRYTRYNDFYYSSIRSHSPIVSNRIQQGSYKTTYSHPEQRREGEALYSKTHSGQNAGTSRRATTATQRSRINPSSESNVGTTRKSATTASDRNFSKPEQNQRRETVIKSRQSETTVRSSGQKSERSNKKETAIKKNDKTQKSETRKSSRR